MQRRVAALSISSLLVLVACGGSDASGSVPTELPADAPAATDAEEAANGSSASGTRSGRATVTMEGTSHSFVQAVSGPEDDFYSLCSLVGGSLQAVLQEVDDAGNLLGGELSVIFLEPGGLYEKTGDLAEVSVQLGEFRFLSAAEGQEVDVPVVDSSASGTVILSEDAGLGEDGMRQTTEVEAEIEVSC